MPGPRISFRDIIAPVEAEDFFRNLCDRSAAHIPGHADKFSHLFSWEEFNRLLNMSKLWSDKTMKVVLDGRDLEAVEFARPGQTREGSQAMLPDPERLTALLQRGATVVLDLVETLSPGIAAVSGALQSVMGGVVVCNAYCSWSAHQGFPVHFDTTDVLALHIEGAKVWRVYEGRARHPIDVPGHNFASFDADYHARAKGKVVKELEMRPGDVLYLPRGQYHEALASSDASLHLSFGINQPTGIDVVKLLIRSLDDEELFRENLPHFDRPRSHREHLEALANRLHDILRQPAISDQVRDWQRERALRDGYLRFNLPAREGVSLYRVRSLGVGLEEGEQGVRLLYPGGELALGESEVAPVRWVLAADVFDAADLTAEVEGLDAATAEALLGRLEQADIVTKI